MVRLGYAQAPELLYWWLDGYADFSDTQQPVARDAIDGWFAWHRRTQLPDYAQLLDRAAVEVQGDVSAPQVCRWNDDLRVRLVDGAAQAVPPLADLALSLSPTQIRHVERRFEKSMKDFRKDYLQESPQDRREASVDRVVDRFEMLYGRVTEAQRRLIEAGIAASPFDPEAWGVERRERQKAVLQMLKRLRDEHADAATARRAVRQVIDDALASPHPAYRSYQQKLVQYNCQFAAQVHNATDAEQRRAAARRLQGWAEDARSLAGNGS